MKIGDTAYILGRYKAKIVDMGTFSITCDVYEGLGQYDEVPARANYSKELIFPKKVDNKIKNNK